MTIDDKCGGCSPGAATHQHSQHESRLAVNVGAANRQYAPDPSPKPLEVLTASATAARSRVRSEAFVADSSRRSMVRPSRLANESHDGLLRRDTSPATRRLTTSGRRRLGDRAGNSERDSASMSAFFAGPAACQLLDSEKTSERRNTYVRLWVRQGRRKTHEARKIGDLSMSSLRIPAYASRGNRQQRYHQHLSGHQVPSAVLPMSN